MGNDFILPNLCVSSHDSMQSEEENCQNDDSMGLGFVGKMSQ